MSRYRRWLIILIGFLILQVILLNLVQPYATFWHHVLGWY